MVRLLSEDPPNLTGSVSEVSLLANVPGRPKLNSDLPLSDGSVVDGPGCLSRITATHPSGPDVKVLRLLPLHTAVRLCLPENWKVGLCPISKPSSQG